MINTFRPAEDVNTSGWWTVIVHPSRLSGLDFSGVGQALTGPSDMATATLNSVAVSVPATVIPMLISTFTAYALVFMKFRGRRLLFVLLISLLGLPNQIAIVPLLNLYAHLGVQGTFPALWLVLTAFAIPLNTFLLRIFLLNLRTDLVDCARMDGASDLQILLRVVTPLAAPAIIGLTVFQFLAVWNELLLTLVFIGPGEHSTLPVALANSITSLETLSAATLITVVVPVSVFLLLQGRLLRGLTILALPER